MIFVDSNIPMYLVGASHPNKASAREMLESAVAAGERLVTDAEIFQEILHRYVALDRRDAIQPAFDAVSSAVDEVFPITFADTERAKIILLGHRRLSARNALHAAVMERERIARIMTFDTGFDSLPGITRLRG